MTSLSLMAGRTVALSNSAVRLPNKIEHYGQFHKKKYCKFGNFREGFNSRNFAYAKFRENKARANWLKHSVIY